MNRTTVFFNNIIDRTTNEIKNFRELGFIEDDCFRAAGKRFYQYFNTDTDAVIIADADGLLYWYITNDAEVYGPLGNKIGHITLKSVPGKSSSIWVYVDHDGTEYPSNFVFFSCYEAERVCFKRFMTGEKA